MPQCRVREKLIHARPPLPTNLLPPTPQINNAGIAFKGDEFDENVARTTIETNYYGTKRACDAFLPLLKDGARVVNVSSLAGYVFLGKMSDALR